MTITYQKKNLQKLTDVETLGSSNEKGLIPQILEASGVLNQTKPQESPYPAQLHIRLIQPLILTFWQENALYLRQILLILAIAFILYKISRIQKKKKKL